MNKHTPGPWFLTGKMTRYVEARIDGGLIQEVAACGPTNADGGYGEQQEANARLIAAAPDLLDALCSVEEENRLLSRMKNCELRRGRGSFGIAVMDDELALEWQSHDKLRRAIEDKRLSIIAKAKGITQ